MGNIYPLTEWMETQNTDFAARLLNKMMKFPTAGTQPRGEEFEIFKSPNLLLFSHITLLIQLNKDDPSRVNNWWQ